MSAATRLFRLAPLFRIWDPGRRGFGFSDQRPNDASIVDIWTGRFDREGRPIYEQDIFSIHHDWKLGWVHALVEKRPGTAEFTGKVTGPDGVFHIAAYQFADAYLEGNYHQHPHRFLPAVAQFPDLETSNHPRWWSEGLRRTGVASKARTPRHQSTRALHLLTSEASQIPSRSENEMAESAGLTCLGVQRGTWAAHPAGPALL